MRKLVTILAVTLLAGCASTQYQAYEGRNDIIEGSGGTKVVVDGMEIWDNGEPPRKFKLLGFIEDERPGGIIPMAQLQGDMVKKAREAGGDALVKLGSQSQVGGYYTSGNASGYSSGNSTRLYGNATTLALRKNSAKFAVVKYVD